MHNWESYREAANSEERIESMKERARKIETDAKRKEELIKVSRTIDVPSAMECNDMLIDAIKAKLTVLDNF